MPIYTHSGIFHADDCFSVAILRATGKFGSKVERVRELPDSFDHSKGDIAVDVGGQHDPSKNRFDHHQRGGSSDYRAAAGKVWLEFGAELCGSEIASDWVYRELIQPIDLADIGIPVCRTIPSSEYKCLSASELISMANPPVGAGKDLSDALFERAVGFASSVLAGCISESKEWGQMADVVKSADCPVTRTLVLSKGGPWQEHLLSNPEMDAVLYVVFPSERGGFCLQCVPDALGSFGTRKSLPQEWAGLRGHELAQKTGLSSFGAATFCHPGRFIGGAETLDDTLKLAALAVEEG